MMIEKIKELFLNKKFLYYTCVGVVISLINIFALWLCIDVLHIPTVISATLVVVFTFILRYILLITFRIF